MASVAILKGWPIASGFEEEKPRVFNDASTLYFNAMSVQESYQVKLWIDDFISKLAMNGSLDLLDWLLLPLGTEQASLVNLANPTKSASNSGCTFTAYRGFLGNGIDAFVNFSEVVGLVGNNYTLNSAMRFAYCNLQGALTGVSPHAGSMTSSAGEIRAHSSGTGTFRINDGLTANFGTAGRTGSRMAIRTDSTTKKAFINGAKATADIAEVSTVMPSGNAVSHRSITAYSDDQIAAIGSGGALSDTQALALQNNLHILLSHIQANY